MQTESTETGAYLLQGFYFQNRSQLSVSMTPIEGAIAVLNPVVVRTMFAATLVPDETDVLGGLVGGMIDYHGEAQLSNIHLDEVHFGFTKRYERQTETIRYEFMRQDGLWVGSWLARYGEGQATCILTPAPARLFELV